MPSDSYILNVNINAVVKTDSLTIIIGIQLLLNVKIGKL